VPADKISSKKLTKKIASLAFDKKADRVVSVDLFGITSIADHFVICSADTDIQTKAIADNIRKNTPSKPLRIEGYEKMNWIILDYVDVVAHIFKTFEREYYNLEKLWGDAKITTYEENVS
tara:strand:+ start:266 stop:625 length:360 start_codon:yes stop_codon:yes gene_type:complete